MQSIILPHCWVCKARFTTSDPPGPANMESHHIIPRQAGGADGPQVTICDVHHTKLHKIALRMSSGKPYFDLLVGDLGEARKKVIWLASRVYMAFEAVKNDPNKKKVAVISLDGRKQEMIERLKKVYPTLKSREAILELALQHLYSKHFTE